MYGNKIMFAGGNFHRIVVPLIQKIGNQKNDAALFDRAGKIPESFSNIRFAMTRLKIKQLTYDTEDMRAPFFRRDKQLDDVAEKNYADLIVVFNRRKRQHRA